MAGACEYEIDEMACLAGTATSIFRLSLQLTTLSCGQIHLPNTLKHRIQLAQSIARRVSSNRSTPGNEPAA